MLLLLRMILIEPHTFGLLSGHFGDSSHIVDSWLVFHLFLFLSSGGRSRDILIQSCFTGVGLIYYGQNYLIYPSAFPPGSRIGAEISNTSFMTLICRVRRSPSVRIWVASRRFGIKDVWQRYIEVLLNTSEDRFGHWKHSHGRQGRNNGGWGQFLVGPSLSCIYFIKSISCSLLPVDRPWLCFMVMAETSVIEFL